MTDPFTAACPVYRNARRLGARSGEAFVMGAAAWGVVALDVWALWRMRG